VILHPWFTVEPWRVRETELDLDVISQAESVFALSNGHIGWRGNFEEGEPYGLPGSYLNGLYELRPLPYAEAGYGYPEAGQTVLNVTNGKVIRLLVDDEPFDVRYGRVIGHERVLDFRAGTLSRVVRWCSPAGTTVQVSSVRLVSLTQRAIAAISYEVEPVDAPMHLVVQSELVANEAMPSADDDPRVAAAMQSPLIGEDHGGIDNRCVLVHRTRGSGLRIAAAMDHEISGDGDRSVMSEAFPDTARVAVTTLLEPGQRLRVVKFVAYGWSGERSVPALRDQVSAALLAARHTGWDGLIKGQRAFLDDFWAGADVQVGGDPEIQQAVRFGLFHILQAGARVESRAIAAKGLTGSGYDGHAFWDTESFVLPVLTYTRPDAAADALRWRHSCLPAASDRASQLGFRGAAFPWRTIAGEECSAYWPAGTAAFHVNADIADAVIRYVNVTGDLDFEREVAADVLVQTARLWRSLGHHDQDGRFRIDGVTGPDEYSAIADNNVYTNVMAQRNLLAAAAVVERYPDRATALGVTTEEAASWRDAAGAVVVPYDEGLGVHAQAEGFTAHETWDFAGTPPEKYPLLLHFPYFDLYRKKVVKQADLVLALHVRGDAFTAEQKARDFAYYEPLTVRDSSLSAATQAVVAAEVGHLPLAMAYLRESALMDLDDLEHNTRDGLHLASLAGAWSGLVAGFGGMRDHGGQLTFAPRLPSALTDLSFVLNVRRCRLRVDVTPPSATYTLVTGDGLSVWHHGTEVKLTAGDAVSCPIPPAPRAGPVPRQPAGREPGAERAPVSDEGMHPATRHTAQ
jgi:alpha,alpha-trehalose phosphorylase